MIDAINGHITPISRSDHIYWINEKLNNTEKLF